MTTENGMEELLPTVITSETDIIESESIFSIASLLD